MLTFKISVSVYKKTKHCPVLIKTKVLIIVRHVNYHITYRCLLSLLPSKLGWVSWFLSFWNWFREEEFDIIVIFLFPCISLKLKSFPKYRKFLRWRSWMFLGKRCTIGVGTFFKKFGQFWYIHTTSNTHLQTVFHRSYLQSTHLLLDLN